MMKIQFFPPHPRLAPYLAHLWTVESEGYRPEDLRTIVPNGRMKLVFPYQGTLLHGPRGQAKAPTHEGSFWLLGMSDRPSVVDADGPFGVLTAEFFPGAVYPFFAFPLHEMKNRVERLTDVLGPEGQEWQDRLGEAGTGAEKAAVLQRFLLSRLGRAGPRDPLVDESVSLIRKENGLITVGELAERTGYSQRYLAMKFDQSVGLGPKTLTEVIRFQNHFGFLTRYGSPAFQHDMDYYDQSHFIKEFRRFVGLPPLAYRNSRNAFLHRFQELISDSYKTNQRRHQ